MLTITPCPDFLPISYCIGISIIIEIPILKGGVGRKGFPPV